MTTFFKGLSGSDLAGISAQYMVNGAVPTATFIGHLYDDSQPPDLMLGAETNQICAVLTANGITPQANSFVFLFMSTYPSAATDKACGWHSWMTCKGVSFAFATAPNLTKGRGCIPQTFGPLYDLHCGFYSAETNALASVVSHEFMEGITDPFFTGWKDSNTAIGEIGDKCAGKYVRCAQVGSTSWQLQLEWSNAAKACVQP
jgi:hypothetical protein